MKSFKVTIRTINANREIVSKSEETMSEGQFNTMYAELVCNGWKLRLENKSQENKKAFFYLKQERYGHEQNFAKAIEVVFS